MTMVITISNQFNWFSYRNEIEISGFRYLNSSIEIDRFKNNSMISIELCIYSDYWNILRFDIMYINERIQIDKSKWHRDARQCCRCDGRNGCEWVRIQGGKKSTYKEKEFPSSSFPDILKFVYYFRVNIYIFYTHI